MCKACYLKTLYILIYREFFICLLLKSPWKPIKTSAGVEKAQEVVGQILGFKFSSYGPNVDTPQQMFWVASLLIKYNIAKIKDIYGHLYPQDEKIPEEYADYLKEINRASRSSGRFAVPKLGGMLNESSSFDYQPSTSVENIIQNSDKSTARLNKPNQKAGLIEALVAIGDLDHAILLIDRQPLLCQMFPEIGQNFCRLLHVMIEKVDKPLQPLAKIVQKKPMPLDSFCPATATLNPHICPIFESVFIGRKHSPNHYRFFYEFWKDDIVKVTNFPSALNALRSYLPYIGMR